MSKAPLISELPNLKARTNSRQPSSSVLQFLCTFDVTHDLFELSNGLYCFSHRHLRLDAVVFALLRGVNLSATSGYARHILPFHCTSIIPASYTRPRLLLLWPSPTSPITVLVATQRVMMSPLCLSLVLIVFLKCVYCRSWLAVLLCEVLEL